MNKILVWLGLVHIIFPLGRAIWSLWIISHKAVRERKPPLHISLPSFVGRSRANSTFTLSPNIRTTLNGFLHQIVSILVNKLLSCPNVGYVSPDNLQYNYADALMILWHTYDYSKYTAGSSKKIFLRMSIPSAGYSTYMRYKVW